MAKDSLRRRWENGARRVRVDVEIGSYIRLEELAGQRRITVEEAVREAVRDWVVRREESLSRQSRLRVEAAMRGASDGRPVGELLADFRAQMVAAGLKVPAENCIRTVMMPHSAEMTLRERREALGLSREKLAFKAGISSATIERFEAGIFPERSRALERLEAALRDEESVAV
jgi:DNA-binding XRE family transcriptional regulator